MNGKSKYTITLVLSLLLGLALITGGCSSSDEKAMEKEDRQLSQDNSEKEDQQLSQDNSETERDGWSVQDDSKSSDDDPQSESASREDIDGQPISRSPDRLGDRGNQSAAEKAGRFPPADDRGTDIPPTDPPAGDRRADNSAERVDDRTVARVDSPVKRVDTPPEELDNLTDPRKRTDHQSSTALVRESRDLRTDYQRPSHALASVDTSSDAPNRGVERGSAGAIDLAGGSSQDRMGDRTDSADDSRQNLAALDRRDIALDQPDAESRAAMADKDDPRGLKGEAVGERAARVKTDTLMAPPAQGEVVVVRRRWTKIRRAPRENSRSIALAYGNDTFQVVNTDGEWVQVRFGRNNRHRGWLPLSALSK